MKNPKEHSDIRLRRRTLLKSASALALAATGLVPAALSSAAPRAPDVRDALAWELHQEYDCTFPTARTAVYKAFELGGTDLSVFPSAVDILAVIAVESKFNPRAVSRTGAYGLMQIQMKVHGTGTHPGNRQGYRSPAANIEKGVEILQEYKGLLVSPSRTLVGYNEGPGAAVNKCGRQRYKPCATRYVSKVQKERAKISRIFARVKRAAEALG